MSVIKLKENEKLKYLRGMTFEDQDIFDIINFCLNRSKSKMTYERLKKYLENRNYE